jgi:DnaA-homolog protein
MNKQLALAIQLNDEATLEDFCWTGNTLVQHHITQVIQGAGEPFLYFWGKQGSGKSHLLQACCQALSKIKSSIYMPLKLLKDLGPEILVGLEEQSLISIDDIDAIAGDKEWEEALFHLYNRVRDNGQSTLIISGHQPPIHCPIMLPDLKSRLSWGLVMQLHELEEDDKVSTLQALAIKRGFSLPASVVQFLLSRCARNMHDLQILLNQLDEASLVAQRKITIPFVKRTLNI